MHFCIITHLFWSAVLIFLSNNEATVAKLLAALTIKSKKKRQKIISKQIKQNYELYTSIKQCLSRIERLIYLEFTEF